MYYVELLFPDFFLILCGFLLCNCTALNKPVWENVEKVVYYFLFPVMLFRSILHAPLDLTASTRFVAAGLLLAAALVLLVYSLPYLPWLKRKIHAKEYAAAAQIGFRFNSFIVLSISERMAGAEGLLLTALIIGLCVPVFNMAAVWPMAKHAERGFMREIVRNPLIIATLLALVLNLLKVQIPAWLDPGLHRVGLASLGLGLMAAGAGMQVRALADAKALGAAVLGIKHLLAPVLAWLLAYAFALDAVQTTVLLSFAATPTAGSAYVLAARMGFNGALVASLVTLSTLLGLLSYPFALGILRFATP